MAACWHLLLKQMHLEEHLYLLLSQRAIVRIFPLRITSRGQRLRLSDGGSGCIQRKNYVLTLVRDLPRAPFVVIVTKGAVGIIAVLAG